MKKFILAFIILLVFSICAVAESAPEESPFPPVNGITNEKAVNLRESAYSKGIKVEQLKKGTHLDVIGTANDTDGTLWYSVIAESGSKGFIQAKFVDLLNDSDFVSVIAQTDEKENIVAASNTATPAPVKKTGRYIGNKNSKVFHRSSCGSLPSSKNRVTFSSRDAAVKSGYKPCSKCKP